MAYLAFLVHCYEHSGRTIAGCPWCGPWTVLPAVELADRRGRARA